jgi:hypothetical protein
MGSPPFCLRRWVEEVGRSIGGDGKCGRPGTVAMIYRRAGINSPRRVAGRPSAAAFTACRRRCAREDDDARKTRRWGRRPPTLTDRSGPHDAREFSSPFRARFFCPECPSAPLKAGDGLGSPDGWRPRSGRRVKSRIRGRDWADLRRPDEKNGCQGPRRACEWRCSYPLV